MEKSGYTPTEKTALQMLPYRLSLTATKYISLYGGTFNELRLRVGQPFCITIGGVNIVSDSICTREDIDFTLRALSGNSLYSHGNTITDGFITTSDGIRAGVCGRAVCDGQSITAIADISSVAIRVPCRAPSSADEAYSLLAKSGFSASLLVYSMPGVGKTTLLREICARMSCLNSPHKIAIVDTRGELSCGIDSFVSADILHSYPRGIGMEIAVRTLSPEYIICDEIGRRDDADAIMNAAASGVHIIASAHAASPESLMNNSHLRSLIECGIFDILMGLNERCGTGYRSTITYCRSQTCEIKKGEVVP